MNFLGKIFCHFYCIRPNSKLLIPFQQSNISVGNVIGFSPHCFSHTAALFRTLNKIAKETMTMVKSYLLLAIAVLLHAESALATQELTMESFGELKKSGKNGIVKFFQTWCGQ
jgi:hypothetical protein